MEYIKIERAELLSKVASLLAKADEYFDLSKKEDGQIDTFRLSYELFKRTSIKADVYIELGDFTDDELIEACYQIRENQIK